jgi:ornithine cyclodeaminase/alanine dehydrogenase-like protein (mu-crystallin family)
MRASPAALPYVDAGTVADAVSWAEATSSLERALLDGLDPADAVERAVVDVSSGQLLMMPAETPSSVGMKLSTVAPLNTQRGLPRIQGLFVLLDHDTLTPVALIDGAALTTLRTPAVSAVAVRHLAGTDARHLVVFGSGPQAWGHIQTLRTIRPIERVTVVGRDRRRAEDLVARVDDGHISADVGKPEAVSAADIVVCATTAAEPLFDSSWLAPNTCVVAVGSHEPDRRELDSSLLGRAAVDGGVVVEDPRVALREAGDVVLAVAEGALAGEQLIGIASLVHRESRLDGTSVFKSVGMGWQDLVVAQAVFDRVTS